MYAKVNIVGKNTFQSKKGKTCYVAYCAILESESEYDMIEDGYKCVTAFVTSDIYKDLNRKDVISGNMSYKDGSVSFWPYGTRRREVTDNDGREEA